MNERIVLPNTSLCAIVRDEKINPAGGIKKFVEAHVPYVEEAVIVDTGSIDGTREILEELESKYSNLKVYDHKFNGFADARNYSLEKVNTKYSLVLDADELITSDRPTNEWWKILDAIHNKTDEKSFTFEFRNVRPNEDYASIDCWYSRLFLTKEVKFYGKLWENHNHALVHFNPREAIAKITHFLPSEENHLKKREDWYGSFENKIDNNLSPSKIETFKLWKNYNPLRELFE